MSEPEFILLDKHGRPIPSNQMTKAMSEGLKEFIYKNKSKLMEYWQRVGFGVRPPIKFDTGNKKWFWDERGS